ncbi:MULTISPECIES: CvpA family protein [unclassified Fibrobacter]|uniref:CvpA family protein n=1 Tax=unclassified Fibrobacter TaxID=2634177 RepID=UPI000D6C8A62|nr:MULTISPECIES: CvpA family protein [unclassified Fibrobacter]PWJ67074.1 membrane protein required for colicin V production [Fibrobacter sp. UWR4]PZW70641.1 membrane protein required for colicin V production [Fibrobacter sp. UWR1]
MNALDIAALVFILILTLLGIWHGFLRGIFRLMAWIAAIVGAYYANDYMSEFIMENLGFSQFSTTVVCIALGFLIPFLFLLLIGHLLKKAIADTSFGTIDRVLGGALGFIKSFLICFALFSILHIMPFGESLLATRDASVGYSVYKTCLEIMGFSSDPIDLVGVAEKKASEITQKAVEKATDKATEAAKDVKDAAKGAALDAAKKVADETTQAAKEAKDAVVEKATAITK